MIGKWIRRWIRLAGPRDYEQNVWTMARAVTPTVEEQQEAERVAQQQLYPRR